MAKTVTYKGTGTPSLRPRVFEIQHRGKTHRFPEGSPVSVANDLADKLSKIEGDKFDIKKEG